MPGPWEMAAQTAKSSTKALNLNLKRVVNGEGGLTNRAGRRPRQWHPKAAEIGGNLGSIDQPVVIEAGLDAEHVRIPVEVVPLVDVDACDGGRTHGGGGGGATKRDVFVFGFWGIRLSGNWPADQPAG